MKKQWGEHTPKNDHAAPTQTFSVQQAFGHKSLFQSNFVNGSISFKSIVVELIRFRSTEQMIVSIESGALWAENVSFISLLLVCDFLSIFSKHWIRQDKHIWFSIPTVLGFRWILN